MDASLRERLPLFGIFSTALSEAGAVDLLLPLLSPRSFAKGQVIIGEGDEGDELFLLWRGRVRIEKRTPYGEMYTVVALDGKDHAFFGEGGLLDSERRSATVIAEDDAECYTLSRGAFLSLGDAHPRLGLTITREISKMLLKRLAKANKDMVILFTALVTEIEGDVPRGAGEGGR